MNDAQTYLVQLHNHLDPRDEFRSNRCGYTLYEQGFIVEEGDLIKNPNLFKHSTFKKFKTVDEYDPLPMEIYSFDNYDVGNYTYGFTVRNSLINKTEIFFSVNITIQVKECTTEWTYAPQEFEPYLLYYLQSPDPIIYWDSFEQWPLCNYTWTY